MEGEWIEERRQSNVSVCGRAKERKMKKKHNSLADYLPHPIWNCFAALIPDGMLHWVARAVGSRNANLLVSLAVVEGPEDWVWVALRTDKGVGKGKGMCQGNMTVRSSLWCCIGWGKGIRSSCKIDQCVLEKKKKTYHWNLSRHWRAMH